MSGNQKQSATGGPQTQRYSTSPFQPMLPQAPSSFTGTEGFPGTTPAGTYGQPGQGPNQGPGLRGIAPTGPPNQSSTPPNTDLKVQSLSGQLPQMQFIQSPPVRTQTPYFPNRGAAAGPPNQTSRIPSQQHRPQLFQYVQQGGGLYMQAPMFYNTQRPPNMMPPSYSAPVYAPAISFNSFTQPPSSGVPQYPVFYPQQPPSLISRATVAPTAAASSNSAPGSMQAQLMPPPGQPHGTFPRSNHKQRRPKALQVIDPNTGEDKLNEIYHDQNSHPASAESSARQTPQPAPPNPNKEVQAAFAKQVAQAISDDIKAEVSEEQPSVAHEGFVHEILGNREIDCPLQYNANAKEFVSTAVKKDSTPIVSANSDAAEVILPKKERDSPAKGRRQSPRDQKCEECDKVSPVVKEEKHIVPQSTPSSTPMLPPEPSSPVAKEPIKEQVDKKSKKVAPPETDVVSVSHAQQPADVNVSNNGKAKNSHRNKQNTHQNAKSQHTAPQHTQPQHTQPQHTQPQHTQPQHTQPQHTQPQQTQPQHTQPQHAQPQHTQPQHTQPQNAQPQQPAQPVSVPAPQPPKSNNRSNKSKELNLKGASKEGTDMDAFNDNGPKTEINANLLPSNRISVDIVNANSAGHPAQPAVVPSNIETESLVNTISENRKIDTNDNVTIKPEPVAINNTAPIVTAANPIITKPANKGFDVTSIIKDTPKTVAQPFPINENHETEKSTYGNEKVLIKNDVSAKVSIENAINDIKSQLPYKPGQWAPDQPNGKKVYERDFLLALKNFPASRQKPDNILDCVLQDDRNRLLDGRLPMGARTDFINPPFSNYGGGKSGSQRGTLAKRNSQTGKLGSRSGDKGSNKPQPKVSISLRGDVKLHEVENAWKPTRFTRGESTTEDDKKSEILYKKVRSVLNKLTPQKFDTLVNQFRLLQIDSQERLQKVIDLVFDKAIDEPNFSEAYAMMCKELQIMTVPAVNIPANAAEKTEDKKSVVFRILLVNRCQAEFEKQSVDESQRNKKLQEINECADLEKKKELSFDLEEYDRRLRMKSVGTIRFIGELFKQQMLTANIMKRCLQTLLNNKDEESLECLCKLLTTVGKELEFKGVELLSIFDEMKRITEGKRQRVSSRIRFMLQDVIELRESNWVPRRCDTNPKTIDEIQKEADTEHLNISMNTNIPRKDERSGGPRGGGGGGGGQRQKPSEDGWNSVSSKSRQVFSIQTEKIKVKMPEADLPLGSVAMFGNWGKGSSSSKNSQPSLTPSPNIYAALENIDPERRPMSSRNKEPYSSKGPSLERNSYKSYEGRGSRSGSQHRDSGAPIRSTGPPHTMPGLPQTMTPMSTKVYPQAPPPAPQSVPKLTEEQLETRIHNSLEEFINDCCSPDTYYQDIAATIPSSDYAKLVCESFNYVLEKTPTARLRTGQLFAHLIKNGNVPFSTFNSGIQEFLTYTDDLVIDIPQIWQFLAEELVHLVTEEVLTFSNLHKLLNNIIRGSGAKKLLKSLIALIIKEKSPNFLQSIWQSSGLQLSDFMPATEVASFVKENNLEFLMGGASSPVGHSSVPYDEVQKKLIEFLKRKAPFDDIVNWITASVGDRVTDNKFIRILATTIFESSISRNKLVPEILMGHAKLIQKYIDNNTEYELQCLYSLQALINKLEHPQGLLLSICNKLYEDSTFCQESFIAWETSTDPAEQEGKGVALKQLTSFFTQLKENDEDEDYSSNSEDN